MLCCREGEGTAIGPRSDHTVVDIQTRVQSIELLDTASARSFFLPESEILLLDA